MSQLRDVAKTNGTARNLQEKIYTKYVSIPSTFYVPKTIHYAKTKIVFFAHLIFTGN